MDDILLAMKGRKDKAVAKDKDHNKDEVRCKVVKGKGKDGGNDEDCDKDKGVTKGKNKAKGNKAQGKKPKGKAPKVGKTPKVDATAGCSKCRWSARGCSKCRHPDFRGLKAGGA